MAKNLIASYQVVHTVGRTSEIHLRYQGGGRAVIPNLSVPEARHLIDILRNESPVAYEPKSGVLFTSPEPVGEGE